MNFSEHNTKILKKYAGQRLQMKVVMHDMDGNVEKVFANRYQAAKWIYENKISEYEHPKGRNYTIACIAGALTVGMSKSPKCYTKIWKILSPYDRTTEVTEKNSYKHIGKHLPGIRKVPNWIVVGRGKAEKYLSLDAIAEKFDTTAYRVSKDGQVNGYSVIPYSIHPQEKQFNSIGEAARFLRVDKETIKNAMLNKTLIHNYLVSIPEEKMEANYKAVKRLNKG